MNYNEFVAEQMKKFDDYQVAARNTAVYPKEQLVYPVLGLVDESEELLVELTRMVASPGKILEEAGDVCWYIAELCSSLQLGLGACWAYTVDRKLYNCPLNILPLRLSAQLAGRYKKAIRSGNVAPDVAVVTAFAAELLFIVDCIVKEAGFSGIFQAMDRNIEKLAARAEAGTLKVR